MMLSWSWITDDLATGARINEQSDLAKLARGGITHVLNLAIPEDYDAMHAASQEPSFPFEYCHNPTPDDGKPKPTSWFAVSRDFALPALQRGGKVYCHCTAGMNRGPSTAYFLLRVQGWTPTQARWRIWFKRPITLFGLRYVPDAERALKELGYA